MAFVSLDRLAYPAIYSWWDSFQISPGVSGDLHMREVRPSISVEQIPRKDILGHILVSMFSLCAKLHSSRLREYLFLRVLTHCLVVLSIVVDDIVIIIIIMLSFHWCFPD